MKKALLLFIIMSAGTFMTGCMMSHGSHTTYSSSDHAAAKGRIQSIEPGVTTKEWVVDIFGPPDREKRYQDGEELLVYENTKHTSSHFSLFLLFNSNTSEDSKETVSFKIKDGVVMKYWIN
jgi:hypothetical protein